MEQLIRSLDPTIIYLKHEISGDTFTIYERLDRSESRCTYCKYKSSRVHSRYKRTHCDLSVSIYSKQQSY